MNGRFATLQIVLGGAICGSFLGIFAGALLAAVCGAFMGNFSLGLDGALFGGILGGLGGVVYGAAVGIGEACGSRTANTERQFPTEAASEELHCFLAHNSPSIK